MKSINATLLQTPKFCSRRGFGHGRGAGVYDRYYGLIASIRRPISKKSNYSCFFLNHQRRGVHGYAREIEELFNGNKAYIVEMSERNPGLLQSLADNGQSVCSFCPFVVIFFFFSILRASIYDSQLFG